MKGLGLHGESSSNNKAIDSSLLSSSKGPMTQLTGFSPQIPVISRHSGPKALVFGSLDP